MIARSKTQFGRRLCVAPMMDYTDRHFRYLLRLLSPSALLYTEMVNAQALVRNDPRRWLALDASEHPVALQLGGSEPAILAAAARIGVDFGYDEINLNCGCPSDRVKSGRFGACLMDEPGCVAECVAAMQAAVDVPVTVKCRIGIEPSKYEAGDALVRFVERVRDAGCETFIVHARKAILNGLSPKENREIPPLRYDVVADLQGAFPTLQIVVNGGIRSNEQARQLAGQFCGVMLGREICQNPYRLAELHQHLLEPGFVPPSRRRVVDQYGGYMEARMAEGYAPASMLRHILALYAGQPGARSWRRFISERAHRADSGPGLLRESLRIVGLAA